MKTVINRTARAARNNSQSIFAAFGVSGVMSTAYLAARAAYDSALVIKDAEPAPETTKEKAELVWKLYVPAGISGVTTIACIVASTRIGAKRTAAMAAAYSISERALQEYREKVIEHVGEKKEQAIRDEIAQDRVLAKGPSKDVIIAGEGAVLCCELHTGRYFNSDVQTLKKAQNEINAKIVHNLYVTLDDFYDIIGLPHTSMSDQMGWDSDKLMDLKISAVLTPDEKPCLAFDYNYTKRV